MPYYVNTETNHSVFFSHIPRTGGRYVTAALLLNGYLDKTPHGLEYSQMIHLDREQQKTFLGDLQPDIEFTVVRNPLTRFISGFWSLAICMDEWGVDHEELRDLKKFEQVIRRHTNLVPYNWFNHQYKYVDTNTLVWKFENGLDDNWRNWMKYNKVPIQEIKNHKVPKKSHDLFTPKPLHPDILENVQKYYEQDYVKFDYTN